MIESMNGFPTLPCPLQTGRPFLLTWCPTTCLCSSYQATCPLALVLATVELENNGSRMAKDSAWQG